MSALEQQKRDALDAQPQGHRLRRAAARRREQPADLRQPDAADEGNRHLGRAEDEQHPRRRCGGDAARPGEPEHADQPAARAVRRHRARPRVWRSSSSTSTTASRRPTRSRRTSGCRSSAWCRRSSTRRSQDPLISNGVPANFAEAFRAIRTQRAVLVGRRRGAVDRGDEHRPGRRQDARGDATWRSRWRRPASGCCSSTPTCASRACTRVFAAPQEPGLSNVLVGNAKAERSGPEDERARACG